MKKKWTKKCKACKERFIPDEYTYCDYCLIKMYKIPIKIDDCVDLEDVLKIIRSITHL